MDDLLRARLTAQLLSGARPTEVVAVVDRLLAVQAQDWRGFRLALRCRSEGTTAADVARALDAGELVVGWLNRGTLHLVRRDDYWWLHALCAPRQVAGNRRRLREEGVDESQAARGVAVVAESLAAGPQTRADLRGRLDRAGVPTAGQAFVHVLGAASIAGHLVRGPTDGADLRFVDPVAWIGPRPDDVDRDALLARLARRYLAGHGPAEPIDLAAWAGLGLRDATLGLAAVAGDVEDLPAGCVALRDRPRSAPLPGPRLLGPFDPVLHGWKSRDFVVGPHGDVVTVNGLFRPFALVDGRVVATWRLADGMVTLEPREPIASRALAALTADAEAVLRFLDLPVRPLLVSEGGR